MNISSWISQRSKREYNMEYDPFYWKQGAKELEMKVRFSIFTIICVCACLPALAWSVSNLIHHRKNGHRISTFIILLLLTDFFELLLSPYILIKYLLNEISWSTDWAWRILYSLWSSSCDYGLLLNQLVALEGFLSVRFPLYTAAVFSSPCLIIFYILVFLCIIIVEILFMQEYFFIDLFMFIVSLITGIIYCGASFSADRHSHTSRKPDHHILVVFIFNLLVIYLPLNLFSFFSYYTPYIVKLLPVWHIPWFLVSVRLISDPLLCVLVCRQNLSIQTSQTYEGTSLV